MAVFQGSDRSENIGGSDGRDQLYGNGGNDVINGYGGADHLFGGTDNDIIFGGTGRDYVWGGSGINDLYGGAGADRFAVNERESRNSDDFIGDFRSGQDRIDLKAWGVSDFSQLKVLFRSSADDTFLNGYFGGSNHFLTIDGVGIDSFTAADFIFSRHGARDGFGTDRADVMFGSDEDDRLAGRDGRDKLLGGDGSDTLIGEEGRDRLYGGAHADTLSGGMQRDHLYGQGGQDIFDFNALADSRLGRSRDFIEDFRQGADRVDVSDIDAIAGGDADGFDWIGLDAFTSAGQLRYDQVGGNTVIYGNVDGDARADFAIIIRGLIDLDGGDFIL